MILFFIIFLGGSLLFLRSSPGTALVMMAASGVVAVLFLAYRHDRRQLEKDLLSSKPQHRLVPSEPEGQSINGFCYCWNCGARNRVDQNYCVHCGKKILHE
jgi:hypothetical protein